MEFSFAKMFKKDTSPVGGKMDVWRLMENFRQEVKRLNIEGVDPTQLIGEDMEIWNRRGSLEEQDFQEYYESIKRDRMQIGRSRINFHNYLKGYKNRFISEK